MLLGEGLGFGSSINRANSHAARAQSVLCLRLPAPYTETIECKIIDYDCLLLSVC